MVTGSKLYHFYPEYTVFETNGGKEKRQSLNISTERLSIIMK
jgi:hypothetical protein